MKIKCYIPSYSCPDYFYKVVDTFAKYPHDIDFVLYVAQPIKQELLPVRKGFHSNVSIKQYPQDIGHKLVHQFYDDIKKCVDDYDIFIYSEDDMEILPETFELFLTLNKELDDDTAIGFLRYEVYEGRKYMNEFQPGSNHHTIAPRFREINGKWYVSYPNIHQGCFALEKRNLKWLLSNTEFIKGWPNNTVMLEDAASNVYKGNWPANPWGLQKVHPAKEIQNLIIHHLSDRHTKINRNFLQLEEVEKEIQLCLTRLHPL